MKSKIDRACKQFIDSSNIAAVDAIAVYIKFTD